MRNPLVELEATLSQLSQLIEFASQQMNQAKGERLLGVRQLHEAQTLLDHGLELMGEIREQQIRLEFQQMRLAALAQLEMLDTEQDLQTTLQSIAEITSGLLPASGGASVLLWNALGREFELASSTLPGHTPEQVVEGLGNPQGATRWSVQNARPLLVPDLSLDSFGPNPLLEDSGVKGYAGFPILFAGQVLGVLYAFEREIHRLNTQDVYFMQLVAHRAATAIHNALKVAEVQLESVTDPLTKVFNRRHFDEVAQQKSQNTEPLAVILLDLDHFKNVNDSYGHTVGDEVLRIAATRLSSALRPTDTLARYGGEEFVVLLSKASLSIAEQVARRLHSSLSEQSFHTSAGSLRVTASFGVAAYQPGTPFEQALEAADRALYEAKRSGRNRVVVG